MRTLVPGYNTHHWHHLPYHMGLIMYVTNTKNFQLFSTHIYDGIHTVIIKMTETTMVMQVKVYHSPHQQENTSFAQNKEN